MKGKIGTIIGLAVYYGSLIGLYAMATKRNNEAFEAQLECEVLNAKLRNASIDNELKELEIKQLKAEIENLKK
jgi:hypothetical protein